MVTVVAVADTELGSAPLRGRRAAADPPAVGRGRRVEMAGWLAVVAAVVVAAAPFSGPDAVRGLATTALWMLAGVLVLRPPYLLAHIAVTSATVVTASGWVLHAAPGAVLTLVVVDGMVLGFGTSRQSSGREAALGESMLSPLRERLHAQAVVPPLEPGWQVETALRAAHGDAFSGDFLLTNRAEGGSRIELVLVDVAGKGRAAGSRALLLSGALGGMLGALASETFLSAANRYVLRQNWDEGFATAVHADVDLATGAFRVAGAGHPPAARFHAGSGRWEVLTEEQGPLLGVVADPDFPAVTGVLDRGDALLLYTDGLVEAPGRDVRLGIDRLMGQAERAMTRGFHGGAAAIVDGAPGGDADDRALVLLWRT